MKNMRYICLMIVAIPLLLQGSSSESKALGKENFFAIAIGEQIKNFKWKHIRQGIFIDLEQQSSSLSEKKETEIVSPAAVVVENVEKAIVRTLSMRQPKRQDDESAEE